MKNIILVIAIILATSSMALAQDVDLLWKARALKANENLEELQEKMRINDTIEIRLQIMLESAYAMIVAMPDVTVKKTPKIIAYHIILNYGDEEGFLDVVYTYDVKTYEYLGVRIDKIPKKRAILLMNEPQTSDYFALANIIDTTEPMFLFSKINPFEAKVMLGN